MARFLLFCYLKLASFKPCRDFEALHQLNSTHPGILAIYQDNYSSKDMRFRDIVQAISNLEAAGIPLSNQFIALNHWNY